MATRVKRYSNTADIERDAIFIDSTREQRETTVDGYTFHWGPNEVRNFLDESVGARHAAFAPGTNIIEDARPFGSSRF